MIPGARQLFPAIGPKVETAGIEPAQCSRRPHLLDLFSGAGGCARGYQQAGFHVVGVDNRPQPRYAGDEFVQADALEYIREHGHEFDAFHASCPCQFGTKAQRIRGNEHPNLIPPTRELLKRTGKPYVIENVPDAAGELRDPVMLCGTMFGLPLYRHRLFECSFPVTVPLHGEHWLPQVKMGRKPGPGEIVQAVGNFTGAGEAREAMGIDWMTRDELAQAIPPAYTRHVGSFLLAEVRRRSLERAA